MTVAWVIGRGGLLGAALERVLVESGTRVFVPVLRFTWHDSGVLRGEIRREVESFARTVGEGRRWEIYWAAGVGTMGSEAGALVTEQQALDALLKAVEGSMLSTSHGAIALASSAGAIYAGAKDPVVDEHTLESPSTPYGFAKLSEEHRAREHATRTQTRLLIARVSTLYGIGQSSSKPQGLLTHISRCVIRNQPVKIFVPLDTIRDYIAADDAAAMAVDSLRSLHDQHPQLKIIASERPATISEILAIFRRLARRRPRIVTSPATTSGIYARRIQFRSVVPSRRTRAPVSLLIGIGQVLAAERLRYAVSGERVPSGMNRMAPPGPAQPPS